MEKIINLKRGENLDMYRKQSLFLFLILLVFFIILAAILFIFQAKSSPSVTQIGYIVVQQGDTLWSIVEDLFPEEDPRPVISIINDLNKFNNNHIIHPGDQILIPVILSDINTTSANLERVKLF
jgi:hypothetical protein